MEIAGIDKTQDAPVGLAAVILVCLACAHGAVRAEGGSVFVTGPSQPLNVGDASIAATAYHDSGAYDRDLELVARQAAKWIAERAPSVRRPALVLDVDDTALSNWTVIVRDDFGRPIGGPCDLALDAPSGWAAWDQLGRDPAILPTLQVFQKARALGWPSSSSPGVPKTSARRPNATSQPLGMQVMKKLYAVPQGANFASATDFKAPIRAEIEQARFTIIANMGDQPSDLFGGHAEKMFLLPNPFYRVR